jgi:hypothetical protein
MTDPTEAERVLETVETSEGSLILLDPGASKQPTFENLLLRCHGQIKWRSQLPQSTTLLFLSD